MARTTSAELTWNEATDPDGDPVVYDLYLDQAANPSTLVAADLAGRVGQDQPIRAQRAQHLQRQLADEHRAGLQVDALVLDAHEDHPEG